MSIVTFDKEYDPISCSARYQLRDHIVEEIQRFGAPTVSDSSSYKQMFVYIEHSFRKFLQKNKMRESARVMGSSHDIAVTHEENNIGGRHDRKNERQKKTERDELYLVDNDILDTFDKMALGAGGSTYRSLESTFVSIFADVFEIKIMLIFMALVCELVAQRVEKNLILRCC